MNITTQDGLVYVCQDQPVDGSVYVGRDPDGVPVVVKVLQDPQRAQREAETLRRLEGLDPPAAPRLLSAASITSPDFLVGRTALVLSSKGRSLREVLDTDGEGRELGDLAMKLLTCVQRAQERRLEPLQLRPEHVLLSEAGEVTLCGWGGAWDTEQQYVPVAQPRWPERPLPMVHHTAVYLWALLVSEIALGRPPAWAGELPVRYRTVPGQWWEDHSWTQSDRHRVDLLQRALSEVPTNRPGIPALRSNWTGQGAQVPPAPPWQLTLGRLAIERPVLRYSMMAVAAAIGLLVGLQFGFLFVSG